MTQAVTSAACPRCSALLPSAGQPCTNGCGGPAFAPPPHPVFVVVAPRSAALAVVLSLLWFGMGHLYVNRTAAGIVLMVVDLVILGLALTGLGLVVAVPAWLVMAPIVAVLSAGATRDFNRGQGVVLR